MSKPNRALSVPSQIVLKLRTGERQVRCVVFVLLSERELHRSEERIPRVRSVGDVTLFDDWVVEGLARDA